MRWILSLWYSCFTCLVGFCQLKIDTLSFHLILPEDVKGIVEIYVCEDRIIGIAGKKGRSRAVEVLVYDKTGKFVGKKEVQVPENAYFFPATFPCWGCFESKFYYIDQNFLVVLDYEKWIDHVYHIEGGWFYTVLQPFVNEKQLIIPGNIIREVSKGRDLAGKMAFRLFDLERGEVVSELAPFPESPSKIDVELVGSTCYYVERIEDRVFLNVQYYFHSTQLYRYEGERFDQANKVVLMPKPRYKFVGLDKDYYYFVGYYGDTERVLLACDRSSGMQKKGWHFKIMEGKPGEIGRIIPMRFYFHENEVIGEECKWDFFKKERKVVLHIFRYHFEK